MTDVFIMGEATERFELLNGLRVEVLGESEAGTIYNVLVNSERRLAQIWVNMDTGGARCFRPTDLRVIGSDYPALLPNNLEAQP